MLKNIIEGYQLSPQQKRVWQLKENSKYPCVQMIVQAQHVCDREKIKSSVWSALENYDILRMKFVSTEELIYPLQQIQKTIDADILITDAREFSSGEKLLAQHAILEEEYYYEFDKSPGNDLKFEFLILDQLTCYIKITAPAIKCDIPSIQLLLNEILKKYFSLDNNAAELVKYADFSEWQNKLMEDPDEEAIHFLSKYNYKDQLVSNRLFIQDNKYNHTGSHIAGEWFEMSAADVEGLKTLSAGLGVKIQTLLYACLQVLMYKRAPFNNLVYGFISNEREFFELKNSVGLFSKVLPLLLQVEGSMVFSEFVQKAEQIINDVEDWKDYISIEKDFGSQQDDILFPVCFEVIDLRGNLDFWRSLNVSVCKITGQIEKFDLKLVWVIGDNLLCNVLVNENSLNIQYGRLLMDQFFSLVHNVINSGHELIAHIPACSSNEEKTILTRFNAEITDEGYSSVIRLFEEQATKNPDNCALVYNNTVLHYGELSRKVNEFTSFLLNNAIKPNDIVGLCCERSDKNIIAILALLKLGAAYVPIESDYPAERIRFILNDSNVAALITQNSCSHLFDGDSYPVIYLEQFDDFKNDGGQLQCPEPDEDNLVYLIYTSGSTGRPKGCRITHRSLANYVQWANTNYVTDESKGFPFFTSIAFDLTITSIFCPLTTGKTVVVYNQQKDIAAILTDIFSNEGNVDAVKLTPTHINILADFSFSNSKIQLVIVGGEALTKKQVEVLRKINPAVRIFNEYGPTEATVGCIMKEIEQEDHILIGKPISNTCALILNTNLKLCGIGEVGELYIGGQCLADGYCNNEQLTAERFLNNHYGQHKIYKTGDLVRWMPDGNIEYVGRKDDQLKIRGFRVEPGEIEAQLMAIENIFDAKVLYTKTNNEQDCLIAYVQAVPSFDELAVKDRLKSVLPDYMIPRYFIRLDQFPITINGKIDKQALLKIKDIAKQRDVEHVAPYSICEKTLVEIWSEVLGKQHIGVLNNFFSLGGDSIRVIRLVSKINKTLGINVSVKNIYDHPCIRELATFIELGISPNDESEALTKAASEIENIRLKYTGNDDAVTDVYPMSDIEKGMIYHNMLDEKKGVYHDQVFFKLRDELFDRLSFERALEQLVVKHDVLRTSFSMNEFDDLRTIYNPGATGKDIRFVDISHLSEDEQTSFIHNEIAKDKLTSFNTQLPGLWRMRVYIFGNAQFGLLWVTHHAILDGWSNASFITELCNVYLKIKEDPGFKVSPLSATVKDFIIEQYAWNSLISVKEFWKEELSDYEKTDLPFNKSLAGIADEENSVFRFKVDDEVKTKLESFCASNNTDAKTVFLAGFISLMKALTNSDDITVGLVSNIRPGIEDGDKILGCFLNTVPCRIRFEAGMRGHQMIEAIRQKANLLSRMGKLSLLEIMKLIGEKPGQKNPIFNLYFNFIDFHIYKDADGKFEIIDHDIDLFDSTNILFDFTVNNTNNSYAVSVIYPAGLYTAIELNRISTYYNAVLAMLVDDMAINTLNILPDGEQQTLLYTYNNTSLTYDFLTVTDLFDEQVKRTPGQTAVVFEGVPLSYEALSDQVNCLSEYLRREHGVGRNDRVGVMLKRSAHSVISLLGVLKSGGCYVPLDYEYPLSRLMYIIRDSGVKVILTESDLSDLIDSTGICPQVLLNSLDLSEYGGTGSVAINEPADSSYIIYTSGSTGKPKGVVQTHAMLLNLTQWDLAGSGIGRGLKHLQYASFSFDASLHDICFALSGGGSVYVVSERLRLDYEGLQELILKEGLEVLSFPFSALSNFFNQVGQSGLRGHSVRYIVSTAEQLYVSGELDEFLRSHPQVELHNHYGPSETHVVTSHRMSYGMSNIVYRPPIGKPVYNTDIYILDAALHLQPVGVRGEVYIGGMNLAIGYANLEEQTQARFIAHPFRAGERLYRSGDIGRWLNDGTIEYLGRNDDQVKVRGYRVEIAEIERSLSRQAGVQEVVVIQRKDMSGDQQLVAYVVGKEVLDMMSVRGGLLEELPAYMVPDAFIHIEELPLTPNGKVDKKKLPDPLSLPLLSSGSYVPARTVEEQELIRIWQEVLGRDRVGIRDNFFEIGGHSLKAMRIISRVYKELHVRLPLRTLFMHPTIESLAGELERLQRFTYEPIAVVVKQDDYALSHGQRRLWILDQLEEGSTAYNMPAAYEVKGELNRGVLERSFKSLISAHEILRTTIVMVEGEPRQQVHESIDFAVGYVDLRGEVDKEEQARRMTDQDAAVAFDLQKGPLLRASVLQLTDAHYILLFTMHHIISDGWSMEILFRELLRLYSGYVQGGEVELPALRIQYKDYAAWQLQQLSEEAIAPHRSYWHNRFKDQVPVLELATDYPRPPVKTYSGRTLQWKAAASTLRGLRNYNQSHGVSMYMTLLSAIKALLYRYTGQADIVIGSPVAGRQHADLENQIGFYVNTLAVRSCFSGEYSFDKLTEVIKQATLEAYEHQVYPFDRLVDDLNLVRDLSRSPLFDVMVQVYNAREDGVNASAGEGLSVSGYDSGYRISKFDLSFLFTEEGEELYLSLEYNTDLFSEEWSSALLMHLTNLLNQVPAHAKQAIKDIDYLSQEEKNRLLIAFNNTGCDYPGNKTVTDLFDEQVKRMPGQTAVVFEGVPLSYEALNDTANQFANCLADLYAIRPGDKVGIHLQRSSWLIIAILGVLKAGGAYVPIDPSCPQDRMDYMLQDCTCKLIIEEKELQQIKEKILSYTTLKPPVTLHSEDLAYVMYTSGSTGVPKGVKVKHKSIVRLVIDPNYIQLRGNEVLLSTGAISFDATTFEFWSMLLNGGTLVLCSQETLMDPWLLKKEILDRGINLMWFTSGWFNQLVDQDPEIFRPLHTILVGGDILSARHIGIVRAAWPHLKIINGYGPTENTTFSLTYAIEKEVRAIPIGSPVNGTKVFILDKNLQLIPVGVPGELYLSGDGLADGYMNDEYLTKEKFIPNPYCPGELLYKTGDLGKWMPDGNIVFLGRNDYQVKIRGYRIELGEIENVILNYSNITDCVIVVMHDQQGDKKLTAYVVSETEVVIRDIMLYLVQRLPVWMLPAYIVQIEKMLLTVNGKVDRQALQLGYSNTLPVNAYEPPRNDIEKQLVTIWQNVLGLDRVGVYDNFFELGGHSLLAIRMASLIDRQLNTAMPVKVIFQFPQLALLARVIGIMHFNSTSAGLEDNYEEVTL